MAVLRNPREGPPDGFRYVQPQTTVRFTADTLTELVDMVVQHRVWKNLPHQDRARVELDIQRQICEGAFPHVCMPENGEDYHPLVDHHRWLTPDRVVEASKTAYRFLESGGEMVAKAESERRAAICRGCQYNRNSACVCTPLYKLLDALVPPERREPNLLTCGICKCALTVKVLLPIETIRGETPSDMRFPPHCWLNPDHG